MLCFGLILFNPARAQSVSEKIGEGKFDLHVVDSLIRDLVTAERRARNCPALIESISMSETAMRHSLSVLDSAKITYLPLHKGQCIALDKFELNKYSHLEIAEVIVNRWLNSPGHEKLIVGEFFIFGGLGLASRIVGKNIVEISAVYLVAYFEE